MPIAAGSPTTSGEDRPAQFATMSCRSVFTAVCWLVLVCNLSLVAVQTASAADARAVANPVLSIQKAIAVQSVTSPTTGATTTLSTAVTLPDDWAVTRPGFEGSVWYRTGFDRPAGVDAHELLALYIARVCSNLEVYLNGTRIYSGGSMTEPVARNCHYPQLVTLPAALVRDTGNLLDLQVQGHALQRVASRQRAGGLSALEIGPQALLTQAHATRMFWNVTSVEIVNLVLAVLGCVLIGLGWMHHREPYLGYFGGLSLAWAALSARLWWQHMPWDNAVMEFLFCAAFAPPITLAVYFMLRLTPLRLRWVDNLLAAQWVLMPATLLLAGPNRLFLFANVWYALLAAQAVATATYLLLCTRRGGQRDFWPLVAVFAAMATVLATEFTVQNGWLQSAQVSLMQSALPLIFVFVAGGLLRVFGRSLREAEDGRHDLEGRVREITAEIEGNFAQLAELRVEQVTEKERKRIAADLHDDLGAKLLTIVHTSESERISTLAREALEEMRLSVRGLTGRPMRLADALADWRAETVLRLGQANIEADWRGPTDEVEQLLPARGFVQTTRILREAVSNIIKHSGASHCKVRCAISERQFGLTVQDNGKGIPMELDGKLDRGHGMSSMKHRAKQLQGQCLVESGPGYGTVIRLTLPL